MSDTNKNLVQRWWDEGINQQRPDLGMELCTDGFEFHFAYITPDYPEGASALRHWAVATFEYFPDFRVVLNDLIAEGDRVAFRVTITATHGGTMFGVPPTGKRLTWSGLGIVRCTDGRISEFWWMPDLFSLMEQLGVVPD